MEERGRNSFLLKRTQVEEYSRSPADISVHALREGNKNMQSEAFFMRNYCNTHIS